MKRRFGLLGGRLVHSHSPMLHGLLADYEYRLYEKKPEELDGFLRSGDFDGLNVTIPYKQAVIPYLAEISPQARRIGSVNTIVRRQGGALYGDNTDAAGMQAALNGIPASISGQKVLVLGSGGTSLTACDVVRQAGGTPVVISRKGENTYDQLEKHGDAAGLINATPVGMYPNVEASPVDLTRLPHLRFVMDAVYNPLRTRLLLQANELGIPCAGGLTMLVWQAAYACQLFTGQPLPARRVLDAERKLRKKVTNLVIVGMPGAGKSSLGRLAARDLDMPLVDLDEEIVRAAGQTIPHIFEAEGEAGFRRREAEALRQAALKGGQVIVTGGGAPVSAQNREWLRMNGVVAHITRPIAALPTEGRPVSQANSLEVLWQMRKADYAACADVTLPNETTLQACASAVEEAYHEALCPERS